MAMKTLLTVSAALTLASCAALGDRGDMRMDGDMANVGVDITQTVVNSPNHTTLEQLVISAGLADTLRSPGPFTVFAPTDNAFSKVPAATRTALMQPGNEEMLRGVLTYHVVAGAYSANDLIARINSGGGSASLTTLQGTPLSATLDGDRVRLTDLAGGIAYVENADIRNANGIIHSIGGVLMPRN